MGYIHEGNRTLNFVNEYTESDKKVIYIYGKARAERDGTSAETRFRLSQKRTSPFKSVGASV